MNGAAASVALRQRWLKLVRKANGGPRARTVLVGLARLPVEQRIAEPLLDLMLAEGTLVMHGERRAATYGLPKGKR